MRGKGYTGIHINVSANWLIFKRNWSKVMEPWIHDYLFLKKHKLMTTCGNKSANGTSRTEPADPDSFLTSAGVHAPSWGMCLWRTCCAPEPGGSRNPDSVDLCRSATTDECSADPAEVCRHRHYSTIVIPHQTNNPVQSLWVITWIFSNSYYFR